MKRADNYSLLLLAGGKSSRMGSNKAELVYEGRTFVENLIEKAKEMGIAKIFLSGYQTEREDVQVVLDIYREIGPLGGMHAGFLEVTTPYCLVLPVDVPQIPKELLETLFNFHQQNIRNTEKKDKPLLLQRDDSMEPLLGIYPVTMVDFIEERIRMQRLSVFRMVQEWGCEVCKVDIPQWQIANINTQEDYKKLLG